MRASTAAAPPALRAQEASPSERSACSASGCSSSLGKSAAFQARRGNPADVMPASRRGARRARRAPGAGRGGLVGRVATRSSSGDAPPAARSSRRHRAPARSAAWSIRFRRRTCAPSRATGAPVENEGVASRQQLGDAFVAQHHIGEEQVMVHHHQVGGERIPARAHHEAVSVVGTFLPEAVVARRRGVRPDWRVLRNVGQVARSPVVVRAAKRSIATAVARLPPARRGELRSPRASCGRGIHSVRASLQ